MWTMNFLMFKLVLEKAEEPEIKLPLDCKENKPVNTRGNQHWIFIGRTDAKVPILWPPDVKSRLIGKDPDARKGWGQEEKGATEDEMVGWHHWLKGHEFEQTRGDSEGWGSLAHCSPGVTESDTTERLKWADEEESKLHSSCHLSKFTTAHILV